MKKLLLTASLLGVVLATIAQTPQVSNSDFENWSEANCGDEIPTGYSTQAEQIFLQTKNCLPGSGAKKNTNKYSGTYALEISSISFMEQLSGNRVAITEAFNGRPTKLVGYTKFTKDGDTDNLSIFVGIDGDNEKEIGYGELSISETQSDYTKFEIMLEYFDNTTTPTNMYIGFVIGTSDDEVLTSSAGTTALIDALSFEYATTTATTNYTTTSTINVFAANKNINFSENVSDVHVVDMTGVNALQETATTKQVHAANLKNGLYVVTYKYNDNYYSKKIVLE